MKSLSLSYSLSIALGCVLTVLCSSCATNKKSSATEAPVPETAATPLVPAEPTVTSESSDAFTIGPGDTISVSVWRQDDLSETMPVDPDGMIHYPPGTTTKVSGLTLPETAALLTAQLTNYVVSPKVSVGTVSITSRKAHILGEVKTPGTVTLNSPTTILDAIAAQGGYGLDAAPSRILLIRQEKDKLVINAVNLNLRDADSSKFSPLTRLRANDIVYVPPSRIADVERFCDRLNTILNPFVNLERGIILGPDVADVLSGKTDSVEATTSLSL